MDEANADILESFGAPVPPVPSQSNVDQHHVANPLVSELVNNEQHYVWTRASDVVVRPSWILGVVFVAD